MTADPLDRLQREICRPPFNAWLAPRAVSAAPDRVEIVLPFRPELAGGSDPVFVHGGVIAALVDIAGYAAAAGAALRPTPTVALQVDYLRAAPGTDLRAVAMVRRLGRSLARIDVEITAGMIPVALGRGTFAIPQEPA